MPCCLAATGHFPLEIIQADGSEAFDLELALLGTDEIVLNQLIGFLAQRKVKRRQPLCADDLNQQWFAKTERRRRIRRQLEFQPILMTLKKAHVIS